VSDLTTRERPYRPGRTAFDAVRELGTKVSVRFLSPEMSGLVDQVKFSYGPVALEAQAVAKAMGLATDAVEFRKVEGLELQAFIDGQPDADAHRTAHQIISQLAKPGVELARLAIEGHVYLVARFPDGAVIGLRGSKPA
jgi:hypothetical protein